MCGLAGCLGPRTWESPRIGEALLRALSHRGPDDSGVQLLPARNADRSLLLAHRRLSIIDLSPAGHQPMTDPETGNWIVYNGEIYNYLDLRARLARSGARFHSRSDTEVILKGYAVWGSRILDELRGMFAFAIWDKEGQRLLLAVDHLGIKPLYYGRGAGGTFLFASELRALLATGLVEPRIDPVGLESYLSFGAVQGPATMLQGVQSLPAGTFLTVDSNGRCRGPERYWTPSFPASGPADADDAAAELRDILDTVVREHLISDVPVGVFLSGGIDSSSLVALACQQRKDLDTFSMVFSEGKYSEAPFSREMASLYSTRHTEICLREEQCLAALPGFLDSLDQPTIDGPNVYIISEAVRRAGVKVVLSGQGGDEVFGGYPTFRWVRDALRVEKALSFLPNFAWRLAAGPWETIQARRRALPDKLGQFLSGPRDPLSVFLLIRQLFPPSERRRLYPRQEPDGMLGGLPASFHEELFRGCPPGDPVNQVSFFELRTYLGQMLLRDGDVMSMAHSLETRVPLLDRRVIEFAARLPGELKLDGRVNKPILVKALGKLLPPSVYERRKQGFTFPWEQWLRGQLRPLAEEAINDSACFEGLGLEPTAVRRLWAAFLGGRRGVSWSRIWSLIVLREWAARRLRSARTPVEVG